MNYTKKIVPGLFLLPFLCHADGTSLITDSHFDFSVRNDYIYLVSNEYPDYTNYDMGTWAQSAQMDYHSGYFYHFGVDVSLYGVTPLWYGSGFYTRHLLKSKTDNQGNIQAVGFVKFPQYVLKQRFNWDDATLDFFEGRRVLYDFGVIDTKEVATTSAWTGVTAELTIKDWNFRAGYLGKYSDADESDDEKLLTKDSKEIGYVVTSDIKYRRNGNVFRAYAGESENYLRRYYLEYTRDFPRQQLTFKFMGEDGLSKWKTMSASNRFFDNHAWMAGIEYQAFFPKNFLTVAWDYTSAPRSTRLGKFEWGMVENGQGNDKFFSAGGARDYTNDGEHLIGALWIHDLTPEFQLGSFFRHGFGMRFQGNDLHEQEIGLIALWSPEWQKSLSMNLVVARDRGFKRAYDNTPYLVDGRAQTSHGKAITTVVKYTF